MLIHFLKFISYRSVAMAENMWRVIVFIVLFVNLFKFSESENILMIEGIPSPSHHIWTKTIYMELLKQGHNVTTIGAFVDSEKSSNLHNIYLDKLAGMEEEEDIDFFEFGEANLILNSILMINLYSGVYSCAKESKGFQTLLDYPDDFKFDLIIWDHLSSPVFMVFFDKFPTAKVISASAYPVFYHTNVITGAPLNPSFIPYHLKSKLENTFMDRLENFVFYMIEDYYLNNYLINKIEKDLRKDFPKIAPIKDHIRKTIIQLVNYNPSLDLIQPMMPSVILVGGLQISTPKPLPQDLEQIFQNSNKGVILFSLGSNIRSENLGTERLTEISEALKHFPDYTFLWKFDDLSVKLDLPKNVFIRKWLPQNDILGHNKTVLFMSHGGGLSIQEATWHGVPIIGFPVFMDQFPNVDNAVKAGVAIKLDLKNIDRQSLKNAIMEMLTNKKYSEMAKLRSKMFKTQPQTPLERAMWWIEAVMNDTDLSYLKSPDVINMGFLSKHSVDIIAFLTIVMIISFYIFYRIFRYIIKKLTSKPNKQKTL